jgi:signal transduction histidine kinase
MKNPIIFLFLLFSFKTYSQFTDIREQKFEATWDQGIPLLEEDKYIKSLTDQLEYDSLLMNNRHTDRNSVKLCREIGIAFYNKGVYDAADWYLSRVRDYEESIEIDVIQRKKSIDDLEEKSKDDLSPEQVESLKKDKEFLENLPSSYENLSKEDLKNMNKKIDLQIKKLISERDSLAKHKGNEEIIDLKDGTIETLEKEKEIVDLTIETGDLEKESKGLKIQKEELKKYLWWSSIGILILFLVVISLSQRKVIKVKDGEIDKQLMDINKKNKYLEYSARIIRHDMHSGINTYIPRGISSLEKRIPDEEIERLKISSPIKMIKDGISHTQKVYKRVYEFTNLVKQKVVLNKEMVNTKNILEDYFSNISYRDNIKIGDLNDLEVNDTLFCNAIDNLVKNGIQYNDNKTKEIKIYMEGNFLIVEDNGRGLTKEEFEDITTKNRKKDEDTEIGLGLSISKTILEEHGFTIESEKIKTGTKIKIKTKKND